MRKQRDVNQIVLQKMLEYCNDIQSLMIKSDESFERYQNEISFRYACDMCVLQIGELTNHFTADFKEQHSEIVWHKIKGLRNVFVHEYGNVKLDKAWKTLTNLTIT